MNNLICVFTTETIFNPKAAAKFDNLSMRDSMFLYALLLSNYVELLLLAGLRADIIFYLNKEDQNFLPKSFFPETLVNHFIDFSRHNSVFDSIEKNIFPNYSNFIFIHYKSIGITKKDLNRIFNLLNREEETTVIGKSPGNDLIFSAHNYVAKDIFSSFLANTRSYDKHLSEVNHRDTYVNLIEKYLSLNTFADFKKLYNHLSLKESLNYCSEQMYERFTHLFIEYKDLLK